jgi:hypothetical protein
MAELDPTGGTIQLGELGLRTPSLVGNAESVDSAVGPDLRAIGGTSEEFQAALDRAAMETTHVVEIEASELPGVGGGAGPDRAGGGETGAVELDVPQPSEGFEQTVLSVDERGVTTWSFAPAGERGPDVRGGGATRTFTIGRTAGPPPEPDTEANRSVFGEVGKQVLKVIAFPVGDVLGRGANSYLDQWETDHQGYGVRDYATANYTEPAAYFDGDSLRWRELAKGRTLLFVHGTFSRAHGAFNDLPLATMKKLQAMYDNRVIAFDHQSISRDPVENIDWLLDTIPDGLTLDFDIICHSRGGLVSRALTERTDPMPGTRKIRVHRTALVGAVNNGTILADVKHWNDLIDTLSTVLNTVGIAVTEMVDLVLAFVRQVAVAAYPHLRGLACMVPSGDFLKKLNARPRGQNEYLAIASNYEPIDPQLSAYFRNVVTDRLFGGKSNDSMVRIDSVCGNTDAGAFATVDEQLLLDETRGVEHARYFGNPDVGDRLIQWLGAGLPVPA